MKETGEYTHCPFCQNKKKGTKIWRCPKCSTIFCGACTENVGYSICIAFPACKAQLSWDYGSNVVELGQIA